MSPVLTRPPGILHTIFFHRYFPLITPQTRPVLSLALPYVSDVELETLIEQRAALLERGAHGHHAGTEGGGRGQVSVRFLERKRRKGWIGRGEDEVCWEVWTVKVTVAEPKTENGELSLVPYHPLTRSLAYAFRYRVECKAHGEKTANGRGKERAKVRQATEQTLLAAVRKIMKYVGANKDHIPPITATSGNPFPYQIAVNQKDAGWAARMGIY